MKSHLLSILGFDGNQEKVYRSLLVLGDAPATRVARHIGMKRTSVYYVLEELLAMGIVSKYKERGVTRYFAEHPRQLKAFFLTCVIYIYFNLFLIVTFFA